MPKHPAFTPEILDPESLETQMMARSLEDFELFVKSTPDETEAGPVKARMRKLLKKDPNVFRAIFGSGFVSAAQELASILMQAKHEAMIEHQRTYHRTKDMPRA